MSFTPDFLEEIRARLTLSTVVGRHVRLTRAGREFKAPCPFHKEKTPSFYVNDQKGFFHCFGCGAHGDVIGFLMRAGNVSFPDAIERLAAEAGLEVPRSSPEEREHFERQKSLFDLVELATSFFEAQLRAPVGRAALAYFQQRGLDDDTIARFRLGYAPHDASALISALTKAGFTLDDMIATGLARKPDDGRAPYSFFRHRVMFPVSDRRGRVVAFGGRLIDGDGPKYINSADTTLFHKGQLLYGLSRARQAAAEGKPVIVCEGYMDVIALVRAGFEGAVAPLGTALTEQQILELWKAIPTPPRMPILCFDGDNAGQRAAFRAVDRILPLLLPDHSVRIAFMKGAKDPDELIRDQGPRAMQAILDATVPLAQVLWEMETAGRPSASPEERAGIRQALEQKIELIGDKNVQAYYKADLRRRLDEAFGWKPAARFGTFSKKETPFPAAQRRLPPNAKYLRQRILLATLAQHPPLFEEFGEMLAMTTFDNATLENVRRTLIDAFSLNPALDVSGVERHFLDRGQADEWASISPETITTHAPFSLATASDDDARTGWQATWAELQKQNLRTDLRQLRQALADNPNDQTFSRFVALQQEVQGEFDDDGL